MDPQVAVASGGDWVPWIEGVAVLTMLFGLLGVLIERVKRKRGFGARTIQLVTVVFLIPTILILGLEGAIDSDVLGTLIGGVAAFTLSKVGEYEGRPRTDSEDSDPAT